MGENKLNWFQEIMWPNDKFSANLFMQLWFMVFLYFPLINLIVVFVIGGESIYGTAGITLESWFWQIVLCFGGRILSFVFDADSTN